jgi:hypothetical protein
MNSKKHVFLMELEQLFDIWSLVFCVTRMHVSNHDNKAKFLNLQYKEICGHTVGDGIRNISKSYGMTEE